MNNFSWLGRPLIQFPGDIIAVHDLIYSLKPDYIIETGVAHGGSLILSASLLSLAGCYSSKVIGIDIDIRPHNRQEIESHPLSSYIKLVEGSSIDPSVFHMATSEISDNKSVLVFLDSNHTHNHVLEELRLYSKIVTPGSYIVVFDTHIEFMPVDYVWTDRDWSRGNNPYTAIQEWLPHNPSFVVDSTIEYKIMITSAPGGFLYKKPSKNI